MPEGDTIFRAARTLQLALGGKSVTDFQTVLPALSRIDEDEPLRGRTVLRVEPRGKNLLIHLSGDLTLYSHLRMNGAWHVYRSGERWQRRSDDMRVVIGTEEWSAVGFRIPVLEFRRTTELARHPVLRALGPDLLGDEPDVDAALANLRARAEVVIADALLDQHVAAGIGNVFKSEVLFVRGVAPQRRVADLSEEQLRGLLETARKMLRSNVSDRTDGRLVYGGPRRTAGGLRPTERLWVYGRRDRPCRRCGTPIAWQRLGRDARSTYWCPRCQPDG
ncbi:MAG: DNA-formamidopyrimidine glycosylase family protein [Thermoanaerobaculia bacterium]